MHKIQICLWTWLAITHEKQTNSYFSNCCLYWQYCNCKSLYWPQHMTMFLQIGHKLYVCTLHESCMFTCQEVVFDILAKLSSCFPSLMRFQFRINWSLAPVASAQQLTCLSEYCLHMLFWSQIINIHDVWFTNWFLFGNIKMPSHFFCLVLFFHSLYSSPLPHLFLVPSFLPYPLPPPLLFLWRETAMSSGEAETHFSV